MSDPSDPSQPAASSPELPVKPGEVLAGRYQVERVLGAGGMGVVVAARHLHLHTRVALKFLLPEIAAMRDVVERFLREAQAATRIQSAHVVRVSDVGTLESGAPYMVMEYLEGSDLGDVLAQRGPLAPAVAVDYLLQAMDALAEAHAAGIVHRDLKPTNLFLSEDADGSPRIKVLDFGISKAVSSESSRKDLTTTQGVLGSPVYMSPEQIRSAKYVDARSDIWSLGVILYELVSGILPYDGETPGAVFAAVAADHHRPLVEVRPDVPRELSDIVDKCLTKQQDARYASVGELAIALAPFGGGQSGSALGRIERLSMRHGPTVASNAGLKETAPPVAATQTDPEALKRLRTTAAQGVTAAAWGTATDSGPRARSRRLWWVLGGVALLAAGLVLVRVLPGEAPVPSAEPASSETTAAATSSAAPSSAPPEPTAVASASSTMMPPPKPPPAIAPPAAPPSKRPLPAPSTTPPAPAKKGGIDDLIDMRR